MNFHSWIVIDDDWKMLSGIIRGTPVSTRDFQSAQLFTTEEAAQRYADIANGEDSIDYEVRELYAHIE